MSEQTSAFHMADIRSKRPTRRRAVAVGELVAGPRAFALIVERRLPKGDALVMAEIAGLQGAKQASALMPLCHPLPLELVRMRCLPIVERQAIRVYCECATEARTGVEMEALAGASAALLTIYDLSKPVEPALSIGGLRLLFKEGGKRGLWIHPQGMSEEEREHYRPHQALRLDGVACAVIGIGSGERAAASCAALREGLERAGAEVRTALTLGREVEVLSARLRELAADGVRVCLVSGGTGLRRDDRSPEALRASGGRRIEGLGEMLRSESARHTPLAWLSRAEVVQLDGMLAFALPGGEPAARQTLGMLTPLLGYALAMIDDGADS